MLNNINHQIYYIQNIEYAASKYYHENQFIKANELFSLKQPVLPHLTFNGD